MPTTKTNILSQNVSSVPSDSKQRKLRLHTLIALSALPLLGIYAAFGVAPETITQEVPVTTVVEELSLPDIATADKAVLSEDIYWQSERVRRDDSVASLLLRMGVDDADALRFLNQDPTAQALSANLRPGRNLRVKISDIGALLGLEYMTSDGLLLVESKPEGFAAKIIAAETERHQVLKSAEITTSLFGATDDANIPDAIAIKMAEVFSSEIDFREDLRKGDRFSVIYEVDYRNGEPVGNGELLAAEFTNNGKTYKAIRFENEDGKASYYTPEGKSLNRSFLRSPLEFSRVSSGFSLGRYHPILHHMRAHKGVDYAAPIGTRIKAPGEGVVDFVGVKGGYGNVIILKHPGNVSTVYGHLSGFAKGLQRGRKVSQGDIIGFVGMTGLSTGPHLHYEFLVGGVHKDPLKVALPIASPVPAAYKSEFISQARQLTSKMALVGNTITASLD